MIRWEYRHTTATRGMGWLNSLGQDGWEAVAMDNGFVLLKRQIRSPEETS